MAEPNDGYAYVEGVSEEECYERWEGVDWVADDDNSGVGVCESNFDFDGWADEYEGNE